MSILTRHLENQKIKSVPGSMLVSNLYTAGLGNEIFLRAIKDREELLGSHCDTCKKTFLPARLFCERCLSRLTQTKVAPKEGTLRSFTKVNFDLDNRPLTEPQFIGFVTFKGFEGGLVHKLDSKDEKKLKVGAKVKVVFAPSAQRKGSILDILYFQIG